MGICVINLILLLLLFLSSKAHSLPVQLQTGISQGRLTLGRFQSGKKDDTVCQVPVERSYLFIAQQTKDSTKVHIPNPLKLKSPYLAVFYSVIPGVLFHGSGHFYAGKGGTGSLLLGLETAGGLLLYLGSLSTFQGSSHQYDTDAMGYTGLLLFVGSWVYDVVGSPIAVVRQNRYIQEIRESRNDFDRQHQDFKLTFVWHFSI